MQYSHYGQGKKRKVEKEIKIKYAKLVIDGKMSIGEAAKEIYGYASGKKNKINYRTVRAWVISYQKGGEKAFKDLGERGKSKNTWLNEIHRIAKALSHTYSINNAITDDEKYLSMKFKLSNIKTKKLLIAFVKKANKEWTIVEILKMFDFPKSTYYFKNTKKEKSRPDREFDDLVKKIYDESNGTYGRKRINAVLQKKYKIYVSDKKVYSSMKYLKIKSVVRNPRFSRESKNTNESLPDIIRRNFRTNGANSKWFTDVTTFSNDKGVRRYLSIIIDTYNNEIVGWSLSNSNDISLANKTIKNAISNKKPSNVILHSDHGTPYFSQLFRNTCKENNIIQSMSRVGNSLDNRPAEYFFSIFKYEWLYRLSKHGLPDERIRNEIEKFMYWYNHQRIQLCLDGMSPIEYSKNKKETQN